MPHYKTWDEIFSMDEGPTFGNIPSEELKNYVLENKLKGKALDIGCGNGRDSIFLASVGFIVTLIEISKIALDKLKKFARSQGLKEKIYPILYDARYWNYPSNFFDLITSVTFLDHLPEEDLHPIMRKIVDSLKPGGIIFLEVHTVDDPGFSKSQDKVSELAYMILHYFGYNELLLLVLDEGLEVVRYEEKIEEDLDHGKPHIHGFANVLARKKYEDI